MTAKEAALPPLTEPITELTLEMRGLYLRPHAIVATRLTRNLPRRWMNRHRQCSSAVTKPAANVAVTDDLPSLRNAAVIGVPSRDRQIRT
jgi:hypothetical protein